MGRASGWTFSSKKAWKARLTLEVPGDSQEDDRLWPALDPGTELGQTQASQTDCRTRSLPAGPTPNLPTLWPDPLQLWAFTWQPLSPYTIPTCLALNDPWVLISSGHFLQEQSLTPILLPCPDPPGPVSHK